MFPKRRLLVLASKPKGLAPSQRYRLEQWAPHLAAGYDIKLDFLPFESDALARLLYERGHLAKKAGWTLYDFARRSTVLKQRASYDAVVIHREAALIGPAIYERLLAWAGAQIIYDFDDAIWMQQPEHRSVLSPLRFPRKTKTICRLASAISAGNEFLAAYARQVNSAVSVVPSTIELQNYPIVEEPADTSFVVCWSGSSTTLVHFEQAREALEIVANNIPLVVKIVCSKPPGRAIQGAETHFIPWSPEDEAKEVGACHVGIMPLPNNEFSRGKCGMKALQYMATGRPVVASPIGLNVELIRPGVNGFLARNTQEFAAALMELAASRDLRAQLGASGRQLVEREFSAEVGAAKFATIVDAVL